MKMRSCTSSGIAKLTYRLTAFNIFTYLYINLTQVSIKCLQQLIMLNNYTVAISAFVAGKGDNATGGRPDSVATLTSNVYT